jgi:hypothetical protein
MKHKTLMSLVLVAVLVLSGMVGCTKSAEIEVVKASLQEKEFPWEGTGYIFNFDFKMNKIPRVEYFSIVIRWGEPGLETLLESGHEFYSVGHFYRTGSWSPRNEKRVKMCFVYISIIPDGGKEFFIFEKTVGEILSSQ